MEPSITVTEHGPYRVSGDVTIHGVDGEVLREGGTWFLCRCGGSRNKPFCDATHGLKCFDGAESADHGPTAARRSSYPAGPVTVYDDRTVCAHFGQCTTRLAAVFRKDAEPFVDPDAASPGEITSVIAGCPSGALSYAAGPDPAPVEPDRGPSITPIADGPYRVTGGITVVSSGGTAYERRARQTLCRCGQSRNKPFCDGSHWYAGFRDPQPAAERVQPPTLYEWAGGMPALERLTTVFYEQILADPDPVLEPVFRHMDPKHPQHVAAWLAETFGGPAAYTDEHGGYEHMVSKHRGLALTDEQRQPWVARMLRAADEAELPADPDFRSALTGYLEWGTRIAVQNSAPDVQVIAHAPVPRWEWGQTPPYVGQPWDDPDAAARGRARYAEQQRRHSEEGEPLVPIRHLNPPTLPANPAYSQGTVLEGDGQLLIVGGQNGVTKDGTLAGDDLGSQTKQALRNVLAVLAEAGATQEDVAKLTIHLVAGQDPTAGFAAAGEVWGPHPTAITVLMVAGLAPGPGYLVEIDALALVPKP